MLYKFYVVEYFNTLTKSTFSHQVNTHKEALELTKYIQSLGFEPKCRQVFVKQGTQVSTKNGLI